MNSLRSMHNAFRLPLSRPRPFSTLPASPRDPPPLRAPIPPGVARQLEGFPSVMNQIVAWGDMDSFAHLNNVQYLRYMESGRINFFHSLSPFLPPSFMDNFVTAKKVGPIVKSILCKYRSPVVYPDTLAIAHRISDLGPDRFTMAFRAVSYAQEKIVAEGECVVVTVDYERGGVKAPVPRELVEVFETVLKREQGE
ncbi:uncharacterized protein VTP21DRAFT_11283 [Calcarisporiella thermophila]|uniref:uncharacterized protein n=1 Tax=Calcarisporiella thermophila TaxID=911321 RepID=UPI003741FEEF